MSQQQGASDTPEPDASSSTEQPGHASGPTLHPEASPRRASTDDPDTPVLPARRGLGDRARRILRVWLVIFAVVFVLVAGLVTNTLLGGPGTAEYAARRVAYSPQSSDGDWLNTGYADGYTSWRTDATVLGRSSDWTTVATQRGSNGQDESSEDLVGLDTATGAERWRVTGLRCMGRAAVLAGSVYCARVTDDGLNRLVAVDIATGGQRVVLEDSEELSFVQAQGERDGTLVITEAAGPDNQQVLAVGPDGAVDWRLDLPWWGQCRFLGDHLGCVSYADAQIAVIDLDTGRFSLDPTEYDHAGDELSVEWLWNGFTTNGNGGGLSRLVFDLNGNRRGDVDAINLPGYGSSGLLYSRDDLLMSSRFTTKAGVDASGEVVAVRFGGSIRMLPSRELIDADFIDLVSADGSMVLARTYTHGGRASRDDSWTIYSSDGTMLREAPRFTTVVDGLLVEESGATSTVHAPGR